MSCCLPQSPPVTTEVAELSRLNKNVLKMSLDNYQSAGPVLLATARLTFRERERERGVTGRQSVLVLLGGTEENILTDCW